MKTWNRAFAGIAAIIICGFIFTGCVEDNNPTTTTTIDVPVTGVTLDQNELVLAPADTETLTCTVSPEDATNKKVRWLSSLPRVANVTDGVVTAFTDGTATITVITDDGRKRDFCTVTVSRIVVESVTLPETLTVDVGASKTLTPTVLPADAPHTLTWRTNDSSKATVSNDGTVTGIAEGTATITVSTHNHFLATCNVSVIPVPVADVTLPETFTVPLFGSKLLPPTVLPPNATYKGVTWKSDDDTAVSVSDNGTLTGIDKRTANITVTTIEGGFTATCLVTVTDPVVPDFPMVLIPSGTFTMGTPGNERADYGWRERPQHEVELTKGFYMSTYEISQGVYRALTGNNPSYFNAENNNAAYFYDWPVDTVSWFDAVEFCTKLSLVKGLDPVYEITNRVPEKGFPITGATVTADWTKNGYRLPTEAEWEYACRAGTTTPFNFKERAWTYVGPFPVLQWEDPYPLYRPGEPTGEWGSDYIWFEWANFNINYPYNDRATKPDRTTGREERSLPWKYFTEENLTHPQDHANKWGLYNMHGNLEEWCWDWYGNYESGAQEDPQGPATGTGRVVRGGSFEDPADYVRSGARNSAAPNSTYLEDSWGKYYVRGFRVVRNGDGPAPKATPEAIRGRLGN